MEEDLNKNVMMETITTMMGVVVNVKLNLDGLVLMDLLLRKILVQTSSLLLQH